MGTICHKNWGRGANIQKNNMFAKVLGPRPMQMALGKILFRWLEDAIGASVFGKGFKLEGSCILEFPFKPQ